FKTDSQGTDLRLFTSLPDSIRNGIVAAEFEPGIIDAYRGEDKLFPLMARLKEEGFWLSEMHVHGTKRINEKTAGEIGEARTGHFIPDSPCWAELTYLRNHLPTEIRGGLLLIVFAVMEKQYGFALELCESMQKVFSEPLVTEAKNEILD